MRRISAGALLIGMLTFTGCASYQVSADVNQTDLSEINFPEDLENWSRGQSCASTFFGLGPFGSASVAEAAEDGGISNVKYVETDVSSFIFMGEVCRTAYGT